MFLHIPASLGRAGRFLSCLEKKLGRPGVREMRWFLRMHAQNMSKVVLGKNWGGLGRIPGCLKWGRIKPGLSYKRNWRDRARSASSFQDNLLYWFYKGLHFTLGIVFLEQQLVFIRVLHFTLCIVHCALGPGRAPPPSPPDPPPPRTRRKSAYTAM